MLVNRSNILIIVNLIICGFLYSYLPVEPEVKKGLTLFFFIGFLWITEAIPLAITAILVPVLANFMGILNLSEGLVQFANPVIYLFLGGFALAAALHKQGIDDALAHYIISFAGNRFIVVSIVLFSVTAFLSMWISNTAATAIMLPLAIGLLDNIDTEHDHNLVVFLLLGTAYSATIGGMATVIGSPPNAIATAILELSFMDWFKVGLPTVLVLLPLLFAVLFVTLRPNIHYKFKKDIKSQSFKLTKARLSIIIIFCIAVIGWVFGKPISAALGITRDFDTTVALSVVILLAVTKSVTWKDIEKNTAWGVFVLFGGGLTLSVILELTGASAYLADLLTVNLLGVSTWIIVLVAMLFVIFFTDLSSNTASGALLIPLFMILAESVGLSAYSMAIAVGVAANCAFMLPVGTPPNAIVFSTGLIRQREMMRIGIFLNVVCAVILTVLVLTIYSIA